MTNALQDASTKTRERAVRTSILCLIIISAALGVCWALQQQVIKTENRYRSQMEEWEWMNSHAAAIRPAPAPALTEPASAFMTKKIQASADENQISAMHIDVTDGVHVHVTLADVSFTAFIKMLSSLSAQHVEAQMLKIQRLESPDHVSADAVFIFHQ